MADASSGSEVGGKEQQSVAGGEEFAQLKLAQREALNALCSGVCVAQTARTLGVARSTIYKWLNSDGMFASLYNEWLDEVEQACRSRLSAMAEKAASAIERALEKNDARAAMALLKGMGLVKPAGKRVTDPEEMHRTWDLEAKSRRTKLEKDERAAELDLLNSRETDQLAMENAKGFKPEDWVQTERRTEGGKVYGKWVKKEDVEVERMMREGKG